MDGTTKLMVVDGRLLSDIAEDEEPTEGTCELGLPNGNEWS